MQLLHPKFLYFLFLLVIPVIVHFFQLRKFKKTPFSNVAFLKTAILQTRKSAHIKKWLILITRLLALACVIIAFSQPYIPSVNNDSEPLHKVFYLDNSFSMQLQGERGELLKRAIQDILESLPKEEKFSLITNNHFYKNTSISGIKNKLLEMEYSSASPDLRTILQRIENEIPTGKITIAISDFQKNSFGFDSLFGKNKHTVFFQLHPVNTNNISIDSLSISNKTEDHIQLNVFLSKTGENYSDAPLSVYNRQKLVAKTSVNFNNTPRAKVQLTLKRPSKIFKGKASIDDHGLTYDNAFYFTIAHPAKVKVVVLSPNKHQDDFLEKIYQSERFDYITFDKENWDYTKMTSANLLVLNGLKEIPAPLLPILSKLHKNDCRIVIIPPERGNLTGYQDLALQLNTPYFSKHNQEEKKITEIIFVHPLYHNVFNSQVENFQYPMVTSSWELSKNANAALNYSDGSPFLVQSGETFLFTASLAKKNSNFQQSPLIVPTFYNLAIRSLKSPQLYFTIGEKAQYAIQTELKKDEILSLKNKGHLFIPKQEKTTHRTWITTRTKPQKAGIYEVVKNDKILTAIAYNYERKESQLSYTNLEQYDQIQDIDNLSNFFVQQKELRQIHELWKWFIIFAIGFLLLELFLLKYLK